MKLVTASLLIAALGLSISSAFAQAPAASEPQELAVRFTPAPAPAAEPEAAPRPAAPEVPAPEATAPAAATEAPAAERVVLTGYVLSPDKKPLLGATVLLKGTSAITTTNSFGYYSLEVPPGMNTLLYDRLGYEGREVKASNFLPVTVELQPAGKKAKR